MDADEHGRSPNSHLGHSGRYTLDEAESRSAAKALKAEQDLIKDMLAQQEASKMARDKEDRVSRERREDRVRDEDREERREILQEQRRREDEQRRREDIAREEQHRREDRNHAMMMAAFASKK